MDGIITVYNKDHIKRITMRIAAILAVICCLLLPLGFHTESAAYAGDSSAIVMEISSNRVLSGENIHTRLPMASTTKVMTALIVVENCKLDEVVTIPQKAVGVEGSSIYLKVGEKLTVKELLYGLMLRSGNDAATALAVHAGKSVEGFVNMMNRKAQDLGLKNTHFCNPHGLHNDNHFTSAYDLAFISAAAMRNKTFAEIVGTKNITVGKGESVRFFHNKNKLLSGYDGATGIKTGFTKKAGRCFVGSSKRNNMEVVCVVLNCGPMFEECMRLMNQAYNEFEMVKVIDSRDILAEIPVSFGAVPAAVCGANQDIYIPLKKNGSERCNIKINAQKRLNAPIDRGVKTGEVEIFVNDCLLFTKNIYTIGVIDKKGAGFWKKIFG
jgi:D-alanyl-D-alanine carboxypeptidase (penicillin-binding protein 5/6)